MPPAKNFLCVAMAQTEHLPIYKSTYDLCLYLEGVVAFDAHVQHSFHGQWHGGVIG